MNLDETDLDILKVLQLNGRLSFRQISERVKVSVPTVSNKISNMENLGLIRGYQANLDAERMGELSVIISVRTRPSDLQKVAEKFIDDDHVRSLFTLSNGRLQMTCTFVEPRLVNRFVTDLSLFPEIMEYELSNITKVMKEEQRALVSKGLTVILNCDSCGKEIWDDPIKVKSEEGDLYYCSFECAEKARPEG
jgi:Lrp/AsnC family leucine-responsive transcriptional regulator